MCQTRDVRELSVVYCVTQHSSVQSGEQENGAQYSMACNWDCNWDNGFIQFESQTPLCQKEVTNQTEGISNFFLHSWEQTLRRTHPASDMLPPYSQIEPHDFSASLTSEPSSSCSLEMPTCKVACSFKIPGPRPSHSLLTADTVCHLVKHFLRFTFPY